MPRCLQQVLALFVFMSVFSLNAYARDISLKHFDADIAVQQDGSIAVTETLAIQFTGEWNGIVREIPVSYRHSTVLIIRFA